MSYGEEEYQQAEDLYTCAELLRTKVGSEAWWAVTCFYCALHYTRAVLFRSGMDHSSNGFTVRVETFDEYCIKFEKGRYKHDVLEELLRRYNGKLGTAYRKLRSAGDECRYTRYRLSDEEKTEVLQSLHVIRRHARELFSNPPGSLFASPDE